MPKTFTSSNHRINQTTTSKDLPRPTRRVTLLLLAPHTPPPLASHPFRKGRLLPHQDTNRFLLTLKSLKSTLSDMFSSTHITHPTLAILVKKVSRHAIFYSLIWMKWPIFPQRTPKLPSTSRSFKAKQILRPLDPVTHSGISISTKSGISSTWKDIQTGMPWYGRRNVIDWRPTDGKASMDETCVFDGTY